MSAPTNAPVLALVELLNEAHIRTKSGAIATHCAMANASEMVILEGQKWPNSAPHTVRQLAEVVRVVAVDDAMVERAAQSLHELCDSWRPGTTAETWGALPDASKAMRREQARAVLAAALTPPEPTGTEGA